jgi:hypothetical protein
MKNVNYSQMYEIGALFRQAKRVLSSKVSGFQGVKWPYFTSRPYFAELHFTGYTFLKYNYCCAMCCCWEVRDS